jgi:fatty acid desaturase (delta-4 desaturase)
MPPNASASILRNRLINSSNAAAVDEYDAATQPPLRSIKRLSGTELTIDGIIYDISDFVHPGGEVIKFFGGNDVTVQYKMIHPYHTSKHLEKMKAVGKVVDFEPE